MKTVIKTMLLTLSFTIPIIFLLLHFMMVKKPKDIVNSNSMTKQFVTAKGRNLYLNGYIFRSVGVNRYNLLSKSTPSNEVGCANTFSESDIDVMFSQLHTLGITSIRFWLFQSFTKSGEDLTRFNYVLADAEKYNLKVIPVFENQWSDCTEGGIKNSDWYESGYLSSYGNYPLSLKDYIGKIVTLYKDNQTIMAWQIINEAKDSDEKSLYNFAKDTSSYIKSLDRNHLVSFGTTGHDQSNDIYRKIHALPTIDILEYHDYTNNTSSLPDTLSARFRDVKVLDKPLIIGEAGISNTVSDRADLFQRKISTFFKDGGAAYIIWSYGDVNTVNDGYNFDFFDPLAQVIKKTAKEIVSIQ